MRLHKYTASHVCTLHGYTVLLVTHTGPTVLGGDLLRSMLRENHPHPERQRRSQHSSPARMTWFSPDICGVTSQTLSLAAASPLPPPPATVPAGGWDGPMRWGRSRRPTPPEPNAERPAARGRRDRIRAPPAGRPSLRQRDPPPSLGK